MEKKFDNELQPMVEQNDNRQPQPDAPQKPPVYRKPPVSIGQHILNVGLICFAVCLGLLAVFGLTEDRQSVQTTVSLEIAESWGQEVNVRGPVLSADLDSATYAVPTDLDITATVEAQKLHREIYETQVFNTKVNVAGTISIPESERKLKKSIISIDLPVKQITYLSGLSIAGHEIDWKRGKRCIYAEIDPSALPENVQFATEIHLRGSSELYISHCALRSKINIDGTGEGVKLNYSPNDRTIADNTFEATWQYSHENEEDWNDYCNDIAGVTFVTGVDLYQKVNRALKFGFIIIVLTFGCVLIFEQSAKRRVPMFTYFLVGVGLVLFYSLLLSFAEVIGFGAAYLVATLMTVALISYYLMRFFNSRQKGVIILAVLSIIYACNYTMLCAEQYALLMGSLLLFVGLAAVMVSSLKLKRDN